MLYQDFDLSSTAAATVFARSVELARRTGFSRVPPAVLRRQARELPAQARPSPRGGDAAGRVAGDEYREVVRAALFDAVFTGDVKACFRSSIDEVRRQNAGLRIRLRLANPSVVDLPGSSSTTGRSTASSRCRFTRLS